MIRIQFSPPLRATCIFLFQKGLNRISFSFSRPRLHQPPGLQVPAVDNRVRFRIGERILLTYTKTNHKQSLQTHRSKVVYSCQIPSVLLTSREAVGNSSIHRRRIYTSSHICSQSARVSRCAYLRYASDDDFPFKDVVWCEL